MYQSSSFKREFHHPTCHLDDIAGFEIKHYIWQPRFARSLVFPYSFTANNSYYLEALIIVDYWQKRQRSFDDII